MVSGRAWRLENWASPSHESCVPQCGRGSRDPGRMGGGSNGALNEAISSGWREWRVLVLVLSAKVPEQLLQSRALEGRGPTQLF